MARDADHHAALASPVRRRVIAVLQDATGPLTAAELGAELGLHVTTVRFHLEQLEQAGLVARESGREPRRGRPSVRYHATAADPVGARDHLIRVLSEAVAGNRSTAADALAAGRRWAEGIDTRVDDAGTAITREFTRLGFEPEPDGEVIRLRGCPFRAAAREHPEVICNVHLGLAQRLADLQTSAGFEVGLLPFVEPELCLLTLKGRES